MHIVRRLREELRVNTTCGASNVSFGLPNRNGINGAFLTMAIGAGMTSAITSPLHEDVMQAVLGADVMMGHDPNCAKWIKKYRQPTEGDGARGGRQRRRRSA
jgi:5-methyltetrahydrofolate--homocysteine methyltransferase